MKRVKCLLASGMPFKFDGEQVHLPVVKFQVRESVQTTSGILPSIGDILTLVGLTVGPDKKDLWPKFQVNNQKKFMSFSPTELLKLAQKGILKFLN